MCSHCDKMIQLNHKDLHKQEQAEEDRVTSRQKTYRVERLLNFALNDMLPHKSSIHSSTHSQPQGRIRMNEVTSSGNIRNKRSRKHSKVITKSIR